MTLTINSTIGDLLADEKAKAILDKHISDFSDNSQIVMAKGFTLQFIAPMSQGKVTPDVIKAIEEDLSKL